MPPDPATRNSEDAEDCLAAQHSLTLTIIANCWGQRLIGVSFRRLTRVWKALSVRDMRRVKWFVRDLGQRLVPRLIADWRPLQEAIPRVIRPHSHCADR